MYCIVRFAFVEASTFVRTKTGDFCCGGDVCRRRSFFCRAPWLSVLYLCAFCVLAFLCVRSAVLALSIAFLYPFRRLIVVLKSRHLPLEVRFAAVTSAWFFCKRRFGRRGGCGNVSICLRPFALSAACRHKVIFPPFPVLRQFLSAFIICAFSALIPQALHTIEGL